jgi:hypothetical protein
VVIELLGAFGSTENEKIILFTIHLILPLVSKAKRRQDLALIDVRVIVHPKHLQEEHKVRHVFPLSGRAN